MGLNEPLERIRARTNVGWYARATAGKPKALRRLDPVIVPGGRVASGGAANGNNGVVKRADHFSPRRMVRVGELGPHGGDENFLRRAPLDAA